MRIHRRRNRWLPAIAAILAMLATVAAPASHTYADEIPPDTPIEQSPAPAPEDPASGAPEPMASAMFAAPMAVIPPGGPIVVDSFADGVDTTPGDNICANVPSGGQCTLRAAIQEANARAGADIIWLPAGTYTLASALVGSGENAGATGDLDITDTLTIIGSNGNKDGNRSATIVQAQSVPDADFDRVFQVNPGGGGAASATFQALTIRHGDVPGGSTTGSGGGIEFETNDGLESLTLYNVVVDQNKTAGTGSGGGVDAYNGSTTQAAVVTIEKSVISNNEMSAASSGSGGGGITIRNISLTIIDSTISGNKASNPIAGAGSFGGGLNINGTLSTVSIERSLFLNNQVNSTGDGGAIRTQTAVPVSVKSSTFSGNSAGSDGGAITSSGTLTLTNVTITGNTATTGNGGGLHVFGGTATLTNTIVYGNTAPTNSEIAGTVSGTYNMVGSNGAGGLTNGTNGNKVGVNPALSTLGNYGGPTQTHRLLAGSPAIDAGTNTGVPTKDQRGLNRIADGPDTDSTATADIGAVEAHPTVSDIADKTAAATVPLAVPFYIGDAAQGVTITATSSNQTVVPNANLTVTNGSTHNPTLTVTGAATGTATITVTVSAAGDWEADTFVMTVTTPPKAGLPSASGTTTLEDTQSTTGLVLTPNASDTLSTHFKITAITNGRLYKNNGLTEITNGSFITKAEGAAGLKFTPPADFYGTGSFTVQAAYDAAGSGLSDPATASITVTAVNDVPSFTKGAAQSVAEDAGAQTVSGWATAISPGPSEGSQTVTFLLTNDNNGLFSAQPAVSSTGTLTYTPAPNANGSAAVTVRLQDNGGTANSGTDTSAPQTFTITVTAVNDPPVGGTDTLAAVLEDSGQTTIPFATLLANDSPGPANESGQALSITGVTAGTGGTVAISGSNVLFTPADDFHGTATFTYTLQDNAGASAPVTVNIPVSSVADEPWVDSVVDIPEDTQSGAMPINISPFDGAEVTHFQISGIIGGKLYRADGTTEITDGAFLTTAQGLAGVKFTPAQDEYNDADPDIDFAFTVTASTSNTVAGLGGSTQTILTVTAVNDAPTAVDDTLSTVAEDSGSRTVPFATLLGNDSTGPSNESSQSLTVAAVGSPTGGTVALSGTDVIFTPTPDWSGTASFVYTVQDNGAAPNTDTATASFTVTAVNDAPTGADDTLAAVDEDSAPRTISFASLLGNDSAGSADESGQALTITAVSAPVGGTVAIDGTNVIFTLTPNHSGAAGFTYTVTDDGTTNGAPDPKTDTANVTFTVNGRAEAPGVTPATTAEDTKSTSGLVISADPADGAAVTHFLVTGVTGGWLYKNDGTTQVRDGDYITAAEGAVGLKFQPAPSLNTPAGDTFSFSVQAALDGSGTGIGPASDVTITVTEVNDAPTGTDDNPTGSITEDYGSLTFNGTDLLANDAKGPANEGGQTLTITAVDNVVGGTASVDGGNVLFTTAANFFGTASFRYTVSDDGTTNGAADPKSSTATVTFTISPSPDAPDITGANIAEDTQSASGLVVTPNALDGAEISHFKVTGINGGRLFRQDDTELALNDLITKAEGAAGLKFTPDADANGTGFSISLAAHDSGSGLTGFSTTAAITVTEVNDAPTGTNDTLAAVAEDSAAFTIAAADLTANDLKGPVNEDGQTLTITAVTAIQGGTVSLDSGTQTITFMPEADFFGTAQFTYTVTDNGTTNGAADNKSAAATVSIPVDARLDVPDITPAITAEETQSTAGLVISKHAKDGAEVTHYLITGITGGTLYLSDGITPVMNGDYVTFAEGAAGLRFTPAVDQNTPAGDTFTFTVEAASDTVAGTSDPVTATITVSEVNDPPVGAADTLADVAEDSGPWTIAFADLTGNDSAGPINEIGQALTVASVSNAVGGSVAISGTDVIFTPTQHFNGTASFEYTVQDNGTTNVVPDAQNAAASATVTFTVTPVNDPPVAQADFLSAVAEDSAPRIIPFADLLANDQPGPTGAADESGQSLTITAVSNVVGGTATVDQTARTITFTLSPDFSNTASFTYTVQDDGTPALTHTADVSFAVTPSAEAPAVTPATTAEGTLSASGLQITADPADGASVTHFRITGITGGTLYQNDGVTQINNGDMITAAQGAAGLKFLPDGDLNTPAGDTFAFIVQAALDAAGTGIGPGALASITVTAVNDAPTGAADDLTAEADYLVAEDSGNKTFDSARLLANDSKGPGNEGGQTLSITAADNAVGGTVTVESGNVLFTPSANFYGTASFRYTLRDNGTTAGADDFLTSTATVTFTISPVPDVPQITGATTDEDTQSGPDLVILPSADDDAADVTNYVISNITGGTLSKKDGTPLAINDQITAAEGAEGLRFTPAQDANHANSTFSIEVKAHDSVLDRTGLAGTAAITVREVNDAPVGAPDTLATVEEDSTTRTIPYATFLANDKPGPDTATDEAGLTLTISAVTAVSGVSVVRDTLAGTVKVTPLPNFHGTASFTYTVEDNGTTDGAADPKSHTVTVTFTVTPVADTPDISPATTAEDTQSTTGLVISRNAVDGSEITHFQITDIVGGTLYQNNGTTVIAHGDYITAAQAGAGLKFTPVADLNSPAGNSFTFTVKAALDNVGTGISATGVNAVITVTQVNDRPTGVADTLSDVAEDSGPWTIPFAALTGNDNPGANEAGQALTVASVSAAVGGTVAKTGTDVIFTPDEHFNGPASFTYIVQDNGITGSSADPLDAAASTTVTFTVTEVNDAPVGADDTLPTVQEDSLPVMISIAGLLANDSKGPANESGQTLSLTDITGLLGGTITGNDGTNLTFTLSPNFHGTAGFTYELKDNGTTNGAAAARTDTADVRFTVTPVADTPTITTTTTEEDRQSTTGLVISHNAVDGAEITHFKITSITGGSVYLNDGTTMIPDNGFITAAEGAAGLKFTPLPNRNSPAGQAFSFTVEAALDNVGTGLSPATVASITVKEKNDAPVGVDDTLTDPALFIEDTGPWTIQAATLLGNDDKGPPNESGQTLIIIAVDNAVGGAIEVTAGGDIRFTPNANHDDGASFRYTLRDNGTTAGADDFLTSTATVTFTISPVPDVPQITGATTDEDTQSGPDLVILPSVDDDAADVTDYVISNITGGTLYKKDGTPLAINSQITAAEGAEGLKFTPAQDANRANGTFSIEVKAHDGVLNRTGLAGTAAITVKEVNDAPEGAADTLATVAEDSATRTIPYATFLANDKPGPDTATDEAGQTLTISAVTAVTGVNVVRDTLAGTVEVTPLPNFHGTASFTYTAEDNGTTNGASAPASDTVTVTFTVTPVADTPNVTPASTAEDTQSTTGLVISRNPDDGVEVTHFEITDIVGGTLYQNNGITVIAHGDYITAAQAGAGLKFTPVADLNTQAGNSFTFTVKAALDNVGTGISATGVDAVITVSQVNDRPTGVGDTLSDVAEDSGPWTIPFAALTGNDNPGANESGQALTVASVSTAVGGSVDRSGTDVIFTPDGHFNGTASFTYIVQDNGTTGVAADHLDAEVQTTAIFKVTEVNDDPVGTDDTLPTELEDSVPVIINIADLLANDSKGPANESGQTLSLTDITGLLGGTITGNDGTNITFALNPNFHGTAGFTYELKDNGTTNGAAAARTDTADVRFTVTPMADTPSVNPTTTLEDTQSTLGLVISRDPVDGAEVTHFKITSITGGSVYLNDGTTMIPDNGFITAAEGAAGLKFTPLPNRNSPAGQAFSFTVEAALDNAGTGLGPATVATITVKEKNDAPVGVDDTLTDPALFIEDTGPWTIQAATLLANDDKGQPNEGGQTLIIIAADNAVGGTVAVVDGNVVFTPNANHDDGASFRYTLRDNGTTAGADDFLTSTATVTFAISPVPDVPQITGATTDEDTQSGPDLVILPSADDDAADVTDYVISNITGGTLAKKDGTPLVMGSQITKAEGAEGLRFTPAQDANRNNGTFSIEVKAHDSVLNRTGLAGTAAITVKEVNDAPEGADDTLPAVAEDSATRIIPYATFLANDKPGPATATDEAGQTLTISAVSAVTGVNLVHDHLNGNLLVTPLPDFYGTASFTYTVEDNGITNGAADPKSHTATVSFTVTEVNDDPIGADDTLPDVAEDTVPWAIPHATLLANDKPGPVNEGAQHLKVKDVTSVAGGTVRIEGTDVIFTPELNFNGTASFSYTLEDDGTTNGTAAERTDTATASFTVTPVNDAPVAADKSFSMIVGSTYTGSVAATDVENNPLTYVVVDPPAKGTVTMMADGKFQYTARALGADTFTYKANDGTVDSNTATVTISVQSVPIVPMVSISAPVTLTREASIVVTGMANPGFTITVNGTTVQADAGGNWSATVALAEGPNVITATNGPATASVTVVRDTKPPVITLTAPAERTDAETVVLTATSEAGAKITIEGQEVTSLTVTLKMGMNRFSATATDPAGNQATATVSVIRVGKVPAKVEIEPGKPGEVHMLNFKVEVPGEAVPQPITLEILSPSAEAEAVKQAQGAAIVAVTGDADATGREDGQPIHGLDDKATVTFTYDPKQVGNPEKLKIYYFDPKLKVWVELGGVVDRKTNTITVQVEHFTTFAAMEPQADAPVLNEPLAQVSEADLTFTGTFKPKAPVSLIINGEVLATGQTDAAGKFTLTGKLTAGRNWVYVKGTGALASREMTVHYQPVGYTDIDGHWAKAQIEALAKLGVVSLYPKPLFQPEAKVTRLEFAVMVARVLGLAPVDEAPAFTDTTSMPAWALPEMTAAVKAGIIKGMPDGSFAPANLVTRAEMAIMLTRALNHVGLDITSGDKVFTDGEQIPVWAKDQVLTAARYGLITGYPDGSFQSGNSTTRAEAVTMLNRLLNLISGK